MYMIDRRIIVKMALKDIHPIFLERKMKMKTTPTSGQPIYTYIYRLARRWGGSIDFLVSIVLESYFNFGPKKCQIGDHDIYINIIHKEKLSTFRKTL
jgi:hypothetical protein